MTENAKVNEDLTPEVNETTAAEKATATTPQSAADDITIPIKFNKEIRRISVEEAAALAQKGMKFDMISSDLERLRQMAKTSGSSITDFISTLEKNQALLQREKLLEECGGNEQLADRITALQADSAGAHEDISELQSFFPEITDKAQLPESVLQRAELTGENLLNCFLRYRLQQEKASQAEIKNRQAAALSSVGSLSNANAHHHDAASVEFLKGLWSR